MRHNVSHLNHSYRQLALLDLDGKKDSSYPQIIDTDVRDHLARQELEAYWGAAQVILARWFDEARLSRLYKEAFYSEKLFYNPAWLIHDMLHEGAASLLDVLERAGFALVFLSARPETILGEATRRWLVEHNVLSPNRGLILKPADKLYTKTAIWKAEIVAEYVKKTTLQLLFVDDEATNRAQVAQVPSGRAKVVICSSLAEAVGMARE